MEKFVQNLIDALNNPNNSEETNEIIRDLLRQQAELEGTLIDQINNALNKTN